MAMEYFPWYDSYYAKTAKLSDQELGRLARALMKFKVTGELEQLAGRESVAFDFIVDDISRAIEAYESRCQKNKANVSKRYDGIQTNTTVNECNQSYTKPTNTNTKAKANTKDISGEISCNAAAPAKHIYGECKNVLLSDDELAKLKEKFPDWQERIDNLSTGIAMKGYKYKSHYLAILKWAKNDEQKPPAPPAYQKKQTIYGSGELGEAEREAIQRVLAEPFQDIPWEGEV